jgi:hypothetical protein
MGKDFEKARLGRGAATGVFCRACVETKGLVLAPQEEPYSGMRTENSGRVGFSAVLTGSGVLDSRPEMM